MGEHILPGNPPVALSLRTSARARRISLRVSGVDGRVTLTLPRGVSQREGLRFATDKADWLRRQLAGQPVTELVGPGSVLPVEGVAATLVPVASGRIALAGGELRVPGAPDRLAARVQGWLKARARDRLAEASDRYACVLGRPHSGLSLRDTRSRWGSCTAQGRLMYSWRLILAPPEVLDYVAAHEVAHLAEMNHSGAFWDTVTRLYGDWRPARDWLRRDGAALHRFRFAD
jgi:predicted metal-dependent hydrolase